MSRKKAVIITSAAIVGLIAIGIVVFRAILGGTPIIIKGSSRPDVNLVMEKNVPSPNGKPDHTIFANYTSIKLTSAPDKCMYYKFGTTEAFKINLTTKPSYNEVFLEDRDQLVGVKFIEDRFQYDSVNKRYESKEPRQIEGLSIDVRLAECYRKGGERIDCPASFPNEWVTFDDLKIELADAVDCTD